MNDYFIRTLSRTLASGALATALIFSPAGCKDDAAAGGDKAKEGKKVEKPSEGKPAAEGESKAAPPADKAAAKPEANAPAPAKAEAKPEAAKPEAAPPKEEAKPKEAAKVEAKPGAAPPKADGPAKPADPFKAPADVAAAPKDAVKTPSGLASKVLKPGTGQRKPKATDSVQVHYTGWQTTGRMFDSSVKRGQPATFPLNQVIAGWTEGVQLMVEGEKRRFWIPEALAYKGRPGAPSGMLVFDVELLKIIEVPKAPDDVAEPPADSDKTDSGLVSKVLKPGTGTTKPTATDRVTVHYTGWTTDGKMFDSSVARGTPATFSLNRVIAGWTEGVGLMVEGEKRRLWIPEDLAYKGRPGAPAGMLVFDVELIKIEK